MTPNQKNLLAAVRECGGVPERYGRVLAEGRAHPSETVLWCFLHGWLQSNGERVKLTTLGVQALDEQLRQGQRR